MRRRDLLPAAAMLAAAPGLAFAAPSGPRRRALELTWLQSIDPDPAHLARFIEANWFAMDRIAVERGLMTDFALWSATEAADWNLLVTVGYPREGGYAAIKAEFETIRAAHKTVPIKGLTLAELGRIVRSERVVIRSGS